MRFKIHLGTQSRFLPVDYQYALSAAVYKLIKQGDEAYSRFLHDQGFSGASHRKFKLFTFSSLEMPRYKLWKEKSVFELLDGRLSFTVSFMADQAAEAFVKGMFSNQAISIGDRFNRIDADVTLIEALPRPFFKEKMVYTCLSPLTIGYMAEGKKYETYLAPDDPRFGELLIKNLLAKSVTQQLLMPNSEQQPFDTLQFKHTGDYKQRLIKIKPFTTEEVKVKGFLFSFTLTAPDYLQELAYYSGFGDNNAMGFGCVEVK